MIKCIKLLGISLFFMAPAFGDGGYKFHYGDDVVVKNCVNDGFVSVCGRIGVVVLDEGKTYSCKGGQRYGVEYKFYDLDRVTLYYCEDRLQKHKRGI